MNARRQQKIRWTLSLLSGIAVAWVPLYLFLGGTQTRSFVGIQRTVTLTQLQKADYALRAYHDAHGVYPEDLSALPIVSRDGWQRPFLYSLPDGNPLVESLGRDGARGGRGMNADVSNRNLYPTAARLWFGARLLEPESWGVGLATLSCGLLAGLLVFASLKNQNFAPQSWFAIGFSLLLALGLAVFGAILIASFHVPSGH